MKYCPTCGAKLPDGAAFCPECGSPTNTQRTTDERRRTVYDGEVHKCPACGEVLGSFVTKCPSCGHEFRGSSTSKTLQDFVTEITQAHSSDIKCSVISNYPIPNTKEDILEFTILAASNIKSEQNISVYNAWLAKFDQCYQKANLLFNSDNEFERIQSIYTSTQKEIKKKQVFQSLNKFQQFMAHVFVLIPSHIFETLLVLMIFVEIIRYITNTFIFADIIIDIVILAIVRRVLTQFQNKQTGNDSSATTYKCPSCGKPISPFSSVCPFCGLQLSVSSDYRMTQELSRRLDEIEKSGQNCPEPTLGLFDRMFNKEEKLQEFEKKKREDIDQQKVECIKNCPMPVTKEDTLDFLLLSKENSKNSSPVLSKAWRKKADQVYEKAEMMFGLEPGFEEIRRVYNSSQTFGHRISQFFREHPDLKILVFVLFLFVFMWTAPFLLLLFF